MVEGFDIEPIPRPSLAPRKTFDISHATLSYNYYGWNDDFYMHILLKGMDEGNDIAYTVNMVATNNRISFPPRVPEYATTDIRIAVWNCRGITRASFMPNLTGLLALTMTAVMVVIDIRVGDDNAREIFSRMGMNHDFTSPFGFIGGVCIFWDSSKVFLVPHKFEEMHATFVVNASEQNVLYVYNASVVTPFSFNVLCAIIACKQLILRPVLTLLAVVAGSSMMTRSGHVHKWYAYRHPSLHVVLVAHLHVSLSCAYVLYYVPFMLALLGFFSCSFMTLYFLS